MSCSRGRRLMGVLTLTFAFLMGCLGSAYSQTANEYFEQGKADLANNSLSPAHTKFQLALALDPNHEGANLFCALTSLLMISNSSEFKSLLDRAGVSARDREVVDRMTAYQIPDQDVEEFMREGGLGEYAK